jgi:hypothetical protein
VTYALIVFLMMAKVADKWMNDRHFFKLVRTFSSGSEGPLPVST